MAVCPPEGIAKNLNRDTHGHFVTKQGRRIVPKYLLYSLNFKGKSVMRNNFRQILTPVTGVASIKSCNCSEYNIDEK